MVDAYWRKIESDENDIENSMQISSILLKLKGYDEKIDELSKIDTNTNNILSNLGKINDNENSISNNLEKIDNFTQYILKSSKDFEQTYSIEKRIFRFNKDKHFYTIFEKEIEYNFIKNSIIYDSENNLIHKYLFNKDTYCNENLDPILHTGGDFCICFKKIIKELS